MAGTHTCIKARTGIVRPRAAQSAENIQVRERRSAIRKHRERPFEGDGHSRNRGAPLWPSLHRRRGGSRKGCHPPNPQLLNQGGGHGFVAVASEYKSLAFSHQAGILHSRLKLDALPLQTDCQFIPRQKVCPFPHPFWENDTPSLINRNCCRFHGMKYAMHHLKMVAQVWPKTSICGTKAA